MSAPKLKTGQVAANPEKPNVKRVSPYPINTQIFKAEGQPPTKGQIVKLTERGFLMKVDAGHFFKVAENYRAEFELPADHHTVKSQTVVVKTYDTVDSHLIEMHFKDLTPKDRGHINTYLVKSRQKK